MKVIAKVSAVKEQGQRIECGMWNISRLWIVDWKLEKIRPSAWPWLWGRLLIFAVCLWVRFSTNGFCCRRHLFRVMKPVTPNLTARQALVPMIRKFYQISTFSLEIDSLTVHSSQFTVHSSPSDISTTHSSTFTEELLTRFISFLLAFPSYAFTQNSPT